MAASVCELKSLCWGLFSVLIPYFFILNEINKMFKDYF